MGTMQAIRQHDEALVLDEYRHLRHRSLEHFWGALYGALWICYAGLLVSRRLFMPGTLLICAVIALLIAARKLSVEFHELAALLTIVSTILIHAGLTALYGGIVALSLGVVAVAVACFIRGPRTALACALGTWALALFARSVAIGQPVAIGETELGILVLYLLVWVTVWLGTHSTSTVLAWAFEGWVRAHGAVDEIQERRRALYSVMRSLEESTFRMERVNNELLIAQHQADEARAIKTRLAATISHELRGPLNVILGFARLMVLSPESYEEPLPRAFRTDIDTIYRNTEHLVTLVNDVLDLSQIEAERLPLVKDEIDIDQDVVTRVLAIAGPLAERKGLRVKQTLAGDLPRLFADEVRLRQALLNLVLNAIRFTNQGTIMVTTTRVDDSVEISVRDTGPGIAEDAVPRLFQEFSQLHPTATREGKGSGLGLSIAKHLVELHRGRISVQSRIGVGTEFIIALPLPESDQVATRLVETADLRKARQREQCLVVHDDPNLVRIVARQMEDLAVTGLPSNDTLEQVVRDLRPRAIVTSSEWDQPIRDQLIEQGLGVPVIACDMVSSDLSGELRSIKGYLTKPVSPNVLLATCERLAHGLEKTILVADDDPDAVRLLERMLQSASRSYRILKAYDGTDVLRFLRQETPDLILLDWAMKEMHGPEVLAKMRQRRQWSEIPVVVVSGHDWPIEGSTLGNSITLTTAQPIEIGRGMRCISAMIHNLTAHYPYRAAAELSVAGSREGSAFGAPRPHPAPAPGEVE